MYAVKFTAWLDPGFVLVGFDMYEVGLRGFFGGDGKGGLGWWGEVGDVG